MILAGVCSEHGRAGGTSAPMYTGRARTRWLHASKQNTHNYGVALDNTCPPHMKAPPENRDRAFGVQMALSPLCR